MNTDSQIHEPPDEARVLASVQRVEPLVLAGIRSTRTRHRGIQVGAGILAGLGLFVGGVAVGAAALRPGDAASTGSRGAAIANQYTIDCYPSAARGAKPVELLQLADAGPSSSGAALLVSDRDPVSACDGYWLQVRIDRAIDREALKLAETGITQGDIRVMGNRIYGFKQLSEADGTPGPLLITYVTEGDTSTVAVNATIALPAGTLPRTAACEATRNWVKVYLRGSKSERSLCASVGLPVWKP